MAPQATEAGATVPAVAFPTRILHTMLRVGDLGKSLAFYGEALGMRVLRREEYPAGRFTLCFLGYGDEAAHAVLELTHNWDETAYTHGSGFGHIALAATDIAAVCERVRQFGGRVLREPGPMRAAPMALGGDIIAFLEDPDGYRIELIEAPGASAT